MRAKRRPLVLLAALAAASFALVLVAQTWLVPYELLGRARLPLEHLAAAPTAAEAARPEVDSPRRLGVGGDGGELPARGEGERERGAEGPWRSAEAERAAMPAAVLVLLSHDRAEYLRRTLGAVLALADISLVRVAVSLDAPARFGQMEAVVTDARRESKGVSVAVWRHMPPSTTRGIKPRPLALIAGHFYAALERALVAEAHSHAILLEEDLLVAPDFLSLFRAAAPLLAADPSLWCVSAWNDNGMARGVPPPDELGRTDFFPGLGWMVSRGEWVSTLRGPWSAASAGAMSTGWDYWLRFSGVLGTRECVFPLAPRTRHIGRRGTNVNAKEAIFLESFALSQRPAAPPSARASAHFAGAGVSGELSALQLAPYDGWLRALLVGEVNSTGAPLLKGGPPLVRAAELAEVGWRPPASVVLLPFSTEDYRTLSARLPLWPAHARGGHAGVVRTGHAGATVLLVDRRSAYGARWLPADERIERASGAQLLPAPAPGVSCDEACAGRGLRCEEAQLQLANSCEALRANFACEAGCGHQLGDEIPCYVTDPARDTHGVCLHSDVLSRCAAAFKSTQRLCVCV
ncbi:GNT-I family-domain-containing protein [Pavlovales sp. CCMP2436]|nr:GNT-I family-domain-containing protein [Pavlovales sp. CCMP2436]